MEIAFEQLQIRMPAASNPMPLLLTNLEINRSNPRPLVGGIAP